VGTEEHRAVVLTDDLGRLESQVRAAPPCTRADFDARRKESGGSEGDLTITLAWDSPSDLDLYVQCPDSKGRIDWKNRQSCGGKLDVDANVVEIKERPVENVMFPAGAWAPGEYVVYVVNARHRGPGRSDAFQVQVKKKGETSVRQGSLANGDYVEVIRVRMP
jgi:uncharacterized protein YfaP (DUF2135 family)